MKKLIFLGVLGLASTLSYSIARQSPASGSKAKTLRPTLVAPVAAHCSPYDSPGEWCPCQCCFECAEGGWGTACPGCYTRGVTGAGASTGFELTAR